MSQSTQAVQCPDCGGNLTAIKLFGRGWENPVSGAAIDAEVVHYAEADAQRSTFKSMFTEAGTVHATLCGKCRRIFLHGDPK
jgi:hypothetical protein